MRTFQYLFNPSKRRDLVPNVGIHPVELCSLMTSQRGSWRVNVIFGILWDTIHYRDFLLFISFIFITFALIAFILTAGSPIYYQCYCYVVLCLHHYPYSSSLLYPVIKFITIIIIIITIIIPLIVIIIITITSYFFLE